MSELKAEGVLPFDVEVRASKYLNNLVEQDHRRVKQRYYPMLGFKSVNNASITLSGIELAQKIRKGQFDTTSVHQAGALVGQVWEAVLTV